MVSAGPCGGSVTSDGLCWLAAGATGVIGLGGDTDQQAVQSVHTKAWLDSRRGQKGPRPLEALVRIWHAVTISPVFSWPLKVPRPAQIQGRGETPPLARETAHSHHRRRCGRREG